MMGFLHDCIGITVRATLFFFLNEQSWHGVLVVRLLVSVDYVRKGRLVSGYSKTHRIAPALFFAPIYPVHLWNTGEIWAFNKRLDVKHLTNIFSVWQTEKSSPLVTLTGCLEVLTHPSQHERTLCANVSRSEDFPPREECFYPLELGFFLTLASFFVPGLRLPPASPRIAIHSCWHCPSCLPDPSPSCCHCTSDIWTPVILWTGPLYYVIPALASTTHAFSPWRCGGGHIHFLTHMWRWNRRRASSPLLRMAPANRTIIQDS